MTNKEFQRFKVFIKNNMENKISYNYTVYGYPGDREKSEKIFNYRSSNIIETKRCQGEDKRILNIISGNKICGVDFKYVQRIYMVIDRYVNQDTKETKQLYFSETW